MQTFTHNPTTATPLAAKCVYAVSLLAAGWALYAHERISLPLGLAAAAGLWLAGMVAEVVVKAARTVRAESRQSTAQREAEYAVQRSISLAAPPSFAPSAYPAAQAPDLMAFVRRGEETLAALQAGVVPTPSDVPGLVPAAPPAALAAVGGEYGMAPTAAPDLLEPEASPYFTGPRAEPMVEILFDDLKDLPSILAHAVETALERTPARPGATVLKAPMGDTYHVRNDGDLWDVRQIRAMGF